MSPERMPSDDRDQAEHARLFKRASDMLALQAGMLRRLEGPVQLDAMDVAGLFAAAATNVLMAEIGPRATVGYLRALADQIEAGKPMAN